MGNLGAVGDHTEQVAQLVELAGVQNLAQLVHEIRRNRANGTPGDTADATRAAQAAAIGGRTADCRGPREEGFANLLDEEIGRLQKMELGSVRQARAPARAEQGACVVEHGASRVVHHEGRGGVVRQSSGARVLAMQLAGEQCGVRGLIGY